MASLNKVLLMGNLTRDPELRRTTTGAAVCRMTIAVNRRYTTAQGEMREEACFVDVDVWGRTAEHCGQYLRKGSSVFIDGRLRMDQWEDKATGQHRSRLVIQAENVQFLNGSPRTNNNNAETGATNNFAAPTMNAVPAMNAAPQANTFVNNNNVNAAPPPPPPMFEPVEIQDDNIPF